MSAAAIKRELGKVKLEARKAPSNDEPDSASDTESDMTELGSDEDEPEYYPGASSTPPPGRKRRDTEAGGSEEAEEIDAIKWARYRDSHEDRDDGIEGWVSLALAPGCYDQSLTCAAQHYGVMVCVRRPTRLVVADSTLQWTGYLKSWSDTYLNRGCQGGYSS